MAEARLFLGGTFNPVHIGHLRLALECGAQMRPKSFSFLPCRLPPHKTLPAVSAEQRLQMLNLAVEELIKVAPALEFTVDKSELDREGPSYTVTTLETLRSLYPQSPLVWVIGMDSLVNLNQWYCWRSLTEWANLLVINRPGWHRPKSGPVAEWLDGRVCAAADLGLQGGVAFMDTTALEISSTSIRHQIAAGLSGYYLLADPVRRYIEQQELYK